MIRALVTGKLRADGKDGAMRPIVEAVGLNWKAQYDRIQRDDVLRASVVMMTTVAEDGKQRELVCLPLGIACYKSRRGHRGYPANAVKDRVV